MSLHGKLTALQELMEAGGEVVEEARRRFEAAEVAEVAALVEAAETAWREASGGADGDVAAEQEEGSGAAAMEVDVVEGEEELSLIHI